MASLLIACGGTTNQGPTTLGETTNQGPTTSTAMSLDGVMSAIDAQRQQSYAAVQQIYSLEQNNAAFQGCPAAGYDYYGNAKSYYTSYVQYNFNGWLERLVSEVQNGATLVNTDPNDPTWLFDALKVNYAFTTWANQVNNYFTVPTNSCSQGQGGYLIATFPKVELPPVLADYFSDLFRIDSVGDSRLKQASEALGYIRSSLDQNTPPTPPGGYSTPSVNDLLGAIMSHEWQDFCGAAQASSC